MTLKTLANAFYDELRDVLSAEKQLLSALPKMIQHATSEKLRCALESHLEETIQQVNRVEMAFEETGKAARAKTCEAMKGLIEEAEEMLKEDATDDVRDALIIACSQKVEHYEIATYGTLCTWARALGYRKALTLLKQNISEEEKADKNLSAIAEEVNQAALEFVPNR